jgi:DNA-binding IclR family transcriptional regulator
MRQMVGSIRKVKSADRTLDIFEVLAGSALPLSASEIAVALHIPKSSLFHLLGTLVDRAYLQMTPDGGYGLGSKFSELAQAAQTPKSLKDVVSPVLRSLGDTLNETTGFSVQRDDNVEVLFTQISTQALNYTMRPGDLAPLYAVSGGKALLAAHSSDWLDSYLERVRFEHFTPNTIQLQERLLCEINRARTEGLAFVDEEFTPGIVGVAAVVKSAGTVVGAMNVAVPKVRSTPAMIRDIGRKLLSSVQRAEETLSSDIALLSTLSDHRVERGLRM